MDEIEIIARLKTIFHSDSDENLILGIGDDAAYFRPKCQGVAIATDLLTEGTHFNLAWSDLYSIGRKAAAANLADIYAMGVPASYLLVALAFDPSAGEAIFDLARGIGDECALVGARVIGGDLARARAMTISITAVGEGDAIVTRSGARSGDALYITDLPGRSLLGLEQLSRGKEFDHASIAFHRAPTVGYSEFLSLAPYATSLTDLSDGILIDAASLARESDVAIYLESEAIKNHPEFKGLATIAEKLGLDPVMTMLTSGEEHTPLFTASSNAELKYAWRIGTVRDRGEGSLISLDGEPLVETGFRHF